MKNYIVFNGLNSYKDLDLLLDMPSIPSINEDVEEIEVEGRNGTLTIHKGTYKDRQIGLNFSLKRSVFESIEDFYIRVQAVEDWLGDITDNDLVLYLKPHRKFKVKRVVKDVIEPQNSMFVNIPCVFVCEPFMYDINESYIVLKEVKTINYPGNVSGECNIKIYGMGNVQLTINDETVQINNVDEYVELDSKLLLCLNKDKESKSRDMIDHFPVLTKGINNISWIGNVSKVEILPRVAYK